MGEEGGQEKQQQQKKKQQNTSPFTATSRRPSSAEPPAASRGNDSHLAPSDEKCEENQSSSSGTRNVAIPRRSLLVLSSAALTVDSTTAAEAASLPFLSPPLSLPDQLLKPDVTNPGPALTGPGQLYYPDWLFGAWDVEARFVDFAAPLGERFVPAAVVGQLGDAKVGLGSAVRYETRFYKTLVDTWQNQVNVALGKLPESRVIADRAFNATSLYNAYFDYDCIEQSIYDPSKDPNRHSLIFKTVGPNGERLPPARQEFYITNRDVFNAPDGRFFCSELFRRVRIGVRSEEVSDSMAIYRFERVSKDLIRARKRRAMFLQPQDTLYFEAWSKAIALLDFDLLLTRKRLIAQDSDATCVDTPKGVVQCI